MDISDKLQLVGENLQQIYNIKKDIHTAIVNKGQTVDEALFSAYAGAINNITTGPPPPSDIPKIIAEMPFEVIPEPYGYNNIWYIRPGGSGNRDGTSWDNAFATREEALSGAYHGDALYVMEGYYEATSTMGCSPGVYEFYGFNKDNPTWEHRQPFLHPSIFDLKFQYIFNAHMSSAMIDGMWIQHGIFGGIYNAGDLRHLVVRNCNNSYTGAAGGIHLRDNGLVQNSIILNCVSTNTGGGIRCSKNGIVKNCVVVGCTGTAGGGIFLTTGGTIKDTKVFNCEATSSNSGGGGIYANTRIDISNVEVINCLSNVDGGGISLSFNSTLKNSLVAYCNTTGNSTGGGVYSYSGNTVENCKILGCSSRNGGGIAGGGENAIVRNVEITNCRALLNGGGAYFIYDRTTLTNLTIANCSSDTSGSGIYLSQALLLYNTVVLNCDIRLATANKEYLIYNCASNQEISFAENADTNAEILDFLDLEDLSILFVSLGIPPLDEYEYAYRVILPILEAIAFIIDELFPKYPDFHLLIESPLIGAGYYKAGVTPDTDADGNERPYPPSIGAYEHV